MAAESGAPPVTAALDRPPAASGGRGSRDSGRLRRTVAFLWACCRANLAAHAEYRLTFAAQVVSMAVNNSTWLAFWALFFARFPEVRG